MKAALHKSEISNEKAFVCSYLDDPHFDTNWHFHSEYQLFVVLEGHGTRFIGDNIKRFNNGDMVFTGPNMPHLWRNDEGYFHKENNLRVRGIVIYFPATIFGEYLIDKPEMKPIRKLFDRAQRGLEIKGITHKRILKLMREMLELEGLDRIIQLLNILKTLAASQDCDYITSVGYTNVSKEIDKDKMATVHNYIMSNYRKNIRLEDVAEIANLTPSSFSRYFKARTNKTFSEFIIELRISYACKLILEDKSSITQICYECGFNTLSNFNRKFKENIHKKPLEYKKEYLKAI